MRAHPITGQIDSDKRKQYHVRGIWRRLFAMRVAGRSVPLRKISPAAMPFNTALLDAAQQKTVAMISARTGNLFDAKIALAAPLQTSGEKVSLGVVMFRDSNSRR